MTEEIKTEEKNKERKTRRDKGCIQATERDLHCLAWIAEQYAIRVDQFSELLSRYPDPKHPFRGKVIAETSMRDQITRWRKAGWVECEKVLSKEPAYLWPTRRGLETVNLADIYTARAPASVRLTHIFAVNQIRLALDDRYIWKSERRYHRERLEEVGAKKSPGPIPDGLACGKNGWLAVEVEMTEKKPADLEKKLYQLVQGSTSFGGMFGGFPKAWVFVPSERMNALVTAARAKLDDKDKARIQITTYPSLVPPERR